MARTPPAVCTLALAVARALLLTVSLAAVPAAAASDEEAAPEAPTIYKWVDDNGIAHYTTDYGTIPGNLRRGARRLLPRTSAGSEASSDAARSGSGYAPDRTRVSEANRWADTDRPRDYEDDGWSETWDEGGSAAAAGAAAAQRHDIDTRIAELKANIEADEEILKRFVAAPPPQDPAEVAYDLSFREVAERLPRMMAELRSLEDERAQLDEP
jgi:hypothetical protein